MKFLTDFGDSALLLPLSAVILIWLLTTRPLPAALWWAGTLAFLGAVMGSLKVLFFACPPAPDIHSPSGHTAFSLTVYASLAVIFAAERRTGWQRAAILVLAIVFAIGIAISRIVLGMHTEPEAVIGFGIGTLAFTIFALGYPRIGGGRRNIALLLVSVVVTLAIFHGLQLNPEGNLHALSALLEVQQLFCPR